MQFKENYIIQLPASVKEDAALSWWDRLAFFFFAHYQGDSSKVCHELGIKERRFRVMKAKLAERGHITRIEEKNQIKYLPVDSRAVFWERLQRFRAASTQGFKLIPDSLLYSLEAKKFSLAYILHVMEVLEWTYRKSKSSSIKKPHHVLFSACKNGVTPDADFVSGYWEKREAPEKAEKQPSRIAPGPKRTVQEVEQQIKTGQQFEKALRAMTDAKRKELRALAVEQIKANGGLAKYGQRIQIHLKMAEIWEGKDHAKHQAMA